MHCPKRCAALLLSLCTLLTFSTVNAQSSVTLSSLRQTAPETVSFTVNGETVTVPILLPEGDTLPLLLCDYLRHDNDLLRAAYPDGGFLGDRYGGDVREDWFICLEGPDTKQNSSGGDPNVFTYTEFTRAGAAVNCPVSPEEPYALIKEVLSAAGLDVDVRVSRQLAAQGKYYCEDTIVPYNGLNWHVDTPNFDRPVEPFKGYYKLALEQYVHGAPVFTLYSHVYTCPDGGFIGMTHNGARMVTQTDYYIFIPDLFEPVKTLEADVALSPLETLRAAIQSRIDEGMLLSVDALELGYCAVPAVDQNGEYMPSQSRTEEEGQILYALVPCWRVLGYDHKDDDQNFMYLPSGPDAQTRESAYEPFFILYDARTGQTLTSAPITARRVRSPRR